MKLYALLSAAFAIFSCDGQPPAPPPTKTTSSAPRPRRDATPAPEPAPDPLGPVIIGPGATTCPTLRVAFSPKGGCSDMVVQLIDSAQTRVRIFAYSFTSMRVTQALIQRKKAGLDVMMLVDVAFAEAPRVRDLVAAGIPVYVDDQHAIMHMKVVVADAERVETGSMNYTNAGDLTNVENCIEIDRAPEIADMYLGLFAEHALHSTLARPAGHTKR